MNLNQTRSFVEVCRKLDQLRFAGTVDWDGLGEAIFKSTTKASTRLLLFWLCSIIDQFYGYVQVWTDGENAMLKLLENSPRSLSDITNKIRDMRKDGKGNIVGRITFDHRQFALVRDDYLRIKNTFDFLFEHGDPQEDVGKKFVRALGEFIASCQGKGGILKVAYFLDGWLFSNQLVPEKPSLADLEKFRGKQRKRLWMFMMFLRRDPSVLGLLARSLEEVYGQNEGKVLYRKWADAERFDPRELDLPTDMWNTRLFKAMIGQLGVDIKGARRIARELASEYGTSPSVFDVTFEIGANRCARTGSCEKCPFGDNALCHKGKTEHCSIPDWLFPYYMKNREELHCDPENCPIGQDVGKNICTRQIDREIEH